MIAHARMPQSSSQVLDGLTLALRPKWTIIRKD